jgi:hypothetical protein
MLNHLNISNIDSVCCGIRRGSVSFYLLSLLHNKYVNNGFDTILLILKSSNKQPQTEVVDLINL